MNFCENLNENDEKKKLMSRKSEKETINTSKYEKEIKKNKKKIDDLALTRRIEPERRSDPRRLKSRRLED